MEPSIYKTPDEKVRPGDIVRLGPSFRALKELIHVGPQTTGKGGQVSQLLVLLMELADCLFYLGFVKQCPLETLACLFSPLFGGMPYLGQL